MPVLELFTSLLRRLDLDFRIKGDLGEVWTHPDIIPAWGDDPEQEVPAQTFAAITSSGDAIISIVSFGNCNQTVIGQLQEFLNFAFRSSSGEYWPDLLDLKLEYRKVGALVEVDIVSFVHNWWSYEQDGVKYQALGGEYHEGPPTRTIEVALVFDPARNTLRAR